MTAIETRMDTLESKTSTEIRSSIANMKEDLIKSIKVGVDKLVDKRHREMEDRRRRNQNVVSSQDEHSYSLGAEIKDEDEQDVSKICSDLGPYILK